MNIAINCRFLLPDYLEGIGNYTFEITRHLISSHPEHHFFLIFDRPVSDQYTFDGNYTNIVLSPPARHPLLWYIWFEWRIPSVLQKHHIDLFISPDGYTSIRSKVPSCMVMHDLAFMHYPQFVPRLVAKYYKYFTPKYLKRANSIACNSHATQEDILTHYEIDISKMSVVGCGASESFLPQPYHRQQEVRLQYTDGTLYFIYVGAIHPRKNIVTLLKAFAKFKKFFRNDMKLILVGRRAWHADEFDRYLKAHPYRNDIIHLESCPTDELALLVASAYAMIYPSYFEGFGIPILESLKCHVPVITSNTSSMPEVVGNAGLLADPNNTEDWYEQMSLLYKDENLYQNLVLNAKIQASKFSWKRTADAIYNLAIGHL